MTEQLQVYQGVLQGLTLIEVMAVQAMILYETAVKIYQS